MPDKAVFHLFIPSLLQKLDSWFHDFSFEVHTPYLSSLILEFEKSYREDSNGFEHSFFRFLDSGIRELPVAYYRNQIHNKNIQERIMCADPVHLEVGMNDVTLTKKISDFSDNEANELISILNKHFQDDGLEFIFGSNACWYVLYDQDEAIQSHDLESMLMQNIIGKQAKSEQRNWQVIQNETQMLLHSSEINQQREMTGLDSINSLWFWGAGKPITSEVDIHGIYSHKISSSLKHQYFAKAANTELLDIPDDMNQLFLDIDKNITPRVLLLDQLMHPALTDNIDEFQKQITKIDNQLIKPLFQAWKAKKLELEIDCCDGTILKPQRPSFYKLWLKPKNLRELVDETGS